MSKPTKETKFLPLSKIGNYIDEKKYWCDAIVFSPETENNHFEGCPPYISICKEDDYTGENDIYFEIPKIIAYYGKKHAGFTTDGRKRIKESGARELANEIKSLLFINK
jgi:hypothetical protein